MTDWKAFQEFAEFNRAFLEAVQQSKKEGKSAEDAAAALKLPEKFKDFGTPRLKDNVTKIYTELKSTYEGPLHSSIRAHPCSPGSLRSRDPGRAPPGWCR